MKSKPVVMEHFSTIHTSFIVDFTFTNNLTILMGDSGTGKTATTSFIRECMAINPKILCFNYLDYQKNIKDILANYCKEYEYIQHQNLPIIQKFLN